MIIEVGCRRCHRKLLILEKFSSFSRAYIYCEKCAQVLEENANEIDRLRNSRNSSNQDFPDLMAGLFGGGFRDVGEKN